MTSSSPWTLTITSDLGLLSMARAFVEAVCQAAGCDEKTTHAIVMATDEATNNVMRHAHRDHPEKSIQMPGCVAANRISRAELATAVSLSAPGRPVLGGLHLVCRPSSQNTTRSSKPVSEP